VPVGAGHPLRRFAARTDCAPTENPPGKGESKGGTERRKK